MLFLLQCSFPSTPPCTRPSRYTFSLFNSPPHVLMRRSFTTDGNISFCRSQVPWWRRVFFPASISFPPPLLNPSLCLLLRVQTTWRSSPHRPDGIRTHASLVPVSLVIPTPTTSTISPIPPVAIGLPSLFLLSSINFLLHAPLRNNFRLASDLQALRNLFLIQSLPPPSLLCGKAISLSTTLTHVENPPVALSTTSRPDRQSQHGFIKPQQPLSICSF